MTAIRLADLNIHWTGTADGTPRRTGYVLETP